MKVLELKEDTTIKEALLLMDEIGHGFLPVVDHDGKLVGILTDGDFRRGVLRGLVELKDFINTNPQIELLSTPTQKIRMKLKALHRRHMPIVDDQGRFVDVVLLDDFDIEFKNNWVVVMVGGLGSRLGQLTANTPKPMLKIGGKPILLHIIEQFKSYGFGKFVLCVNYRADVIKEFFGNGSEFGITVAYTHEKKRLGTAGALTLIDFDLEEPFFVINGDVFTTVEFDKLLEHHVSLKSHATMCVKRHPQSIPFAAVEFDESGTLINIKEKPIIDYYINTGIYVLDKEVVNLIPKDEFYDMPMLFENLIEEKNFTSKVYKVDEYWLDLGRPDDLEQINGAFGFNV